MDQVKTVSYPEAKPINDQNIRGSFAKKYFPIGLILFSFLPIYSMFRTGEFSFNHTFTFVFCFIYALVLLSKGSK